MEAKITIVKKTWTVIFHFGRGNSTIHEGLTKVQALDMIHTAVFHNEDCINFQCFRIDN